MRSIYSGVSCGGECVDSSCSWLPPTYFALLPWWLAMHIFFIGARPSFSPLSATACYGSLSLGTFFPCLLLWPVKPVPFYDWCHLWFPCSRGCQWRLILFIITANILFPAPAFPSGAFTQFYSRLLCCGGVNTVDYWTMHH